MDIASAQSVKIQSEIIDKLNYACHQSAFPFLRSLRVKSLESEQTIENITVTLSANPAFLKPKSWRLDRLAPGGEIVIPDRDVELNGEFLLAMAECTRGQVSIKVEIADRVLGELTKPVDLLAFNEWGGASAMPDLLAAFSMPNDPAVDRVLRDASLVLRNAGKPDSVDGYKSKSRQRVWEIVSAIYTAIANLGISYAVPPASFEQNGQKIRFPSPILENRLATCLDSTLLFASVIEQAGLYPIVVLPQGHALVGVWLQPEGLNTIVTDEAELLRKRVQLNELVLIETTCVTAHPPLPFSKAVKTASDLLHPDKDDSFHAAVDINRARMHRILPLGIKTNDQAKPEEEADQPSENLTLEEAPVLPGFDERPEDGILPETPAGRLERWQRKLLDLSARNPLLHHRDSKSSIKIICPDPALLEDKLASGAKLTLQAIPQPAPFDQDQEIHRQRTGELITEEFARDALERKQVLVDLPENELHARAVEIYRRAQTALQEGGSNTLFLALGFLLWKRNEKEDRRFRAPLILVPVTLVRQSVRSGIKLMAHDDEPSFNTTLLEMLRKDFHIDIRDLDTHLPQDETGIDVKAIWNIVRRHVKDSPGFEVIEEVSLGHFSFAKYLMWKDLVDRTESLRQNRLVKHLIDTPRAPYTCSIPFVDGSQIDKEFVPADFLTPLPADSSQMASIATADKGKDFIIIGPPGTGKSQTISNLIAHLLGKGKTVLFVSEKTAALEVVYRRLKEIGLGRFCLELHSNKARKADVLHQLRNAWDGTRTLSASAWEKRAEELRQSRDKLNRFVDHLHKKRRNGLTAYYAIGVKVRDEAFGCRVSLSWPSAEQHDEATLESMRAAVRTLRIQAAAVGDVSNSPFRLVSHDDWSPVWESRMAEQCHHLAVAIREVERTFWEFLDKVGIDGADRSLDRMESLAELASILLDSYKKQTAFALEPEGPERMEALAEAIERLEAYAEAQAALSCEYDPLAWKRLDGHEIARRRKEVELQWWPLRFFARRNLVRDMREGGAKGTPNPLLDAPILTKLRIDGEAIDRLGNLLSSFRDWQGYTTHPQSLRALLELGQRLRAVVGQFAETPQALIELRAKLHALLQDGNDLLAPEAAVGKTAFAFQKAYASWGSACDAFGVQAGQPVRDFFTETPDALTSIRQEIEQIASHRPELRDWCHWRHRRKEAIAFELEPLVKSIEEGSISAVELEAAFEAAYCTWFSGAIMAEDEVLRTFSTPEHMAEIDFFRKLDDQFLKLTASQIEARLSCQIPNAEDVTRKSSWGVLRREIQKKMRHIPVRQLMKEIPDVLTTLAPCMMMSPLSVAQYLSADQALFDVIIFDEASQITVWDAIGSLARGRQAIVAGDPKQMPPTNFFARADDGSEDDIDGDSDMESILDEMQASNIPERKLNLHYRSRRESLIAFSNNKYYDNELVTFPAPLNPDCGVRLVNPEGVYARGKARHNEGEAKAIVKEIVRRLTHKEPTIRQQSIGVVTFNAEQQSLIQNLLDEACSKHPEIEWAFSADHVLEPVFVKNLETVQGDERDVILFSVTYGPDHSGRVSMNFGPLNKSGGERRLNVAMTRARYEMIVFSTLRPDQINLSRTQAQAVAHLKHFLEYAERGPSALGVEVRGSVGDFDSPFEMAVASALREKGWIVQPQIGVSAYRIDLGVLHPDKPGLYLAGIECDGAMYHSAAFARERDKIRQAVLEGLGWTLLRVWSTDWWTNRAGALDKLHKALQDGLEADRQRTKEAAASAEREGQQEETFPSFENEGDEESLQAETATPEEQTGTTLETATIEDAPEPLPVSSQPPQPESPARILDNPSQVLLVPESAPLIESRITRYIYASLDGEAFLPDENLFYLEEYEDRLAKMVCHVIETEGPIHEDVLVRRIARHHGFKRAGRQIREIVLKLAKQCSLKTKEEVGEFFWPKEADPSLMAWARYQDRDEEMRKIEHICKEELWAINTLLALQGDPQEIARSLGISRLSQDARKRMQKIIAKMAPRDSSADGFRSPGIPAESNREEN